jgi:hypothetical protein
MCYALSETLEARAALGLRRLRQRRGDREQRSALATEAGWFTETAPRKDSQGETRR